MVNVTNNYKLIDLTIDGEEMTLPINTSDAWSVMEVQFDGKTIVVNENDIVEFIIDSTGEIKKGVVTKLKGKGDKTKIQLRPIGLDCEEIWSVISLREGSLKVIGQDVEQE